MPYLPTLAGHPTGGFLPIRRDLDRVCLQLLAVGMDGYTEPGKFHDSVKAALHVENGYESEFESPRRGAWRVVLDIVLIEPVATDHFCPPPRIRRYGIAGSPNECCSLQRVPILMLCQSTITELHLVRKSQVMVFTPTHYNDSSSWLMLFSAHESR